MYITEEPCIVSTSLKIVEFLESAGIIFGKLIIGIFLGCGLRREASNMRATREQITKETLGLISVKTVLMANESESYHRV